MAEVDVKYCDISACTMARTAGQELNSAGLVKTEQKNSRVC
jgi:hypothetical protein